ncbi:MAG: hypothetical protein LAP39_08605 [Acidobacteriia bacterium]|nr:hypothetical protein [Terriglobia bacterium]
MGRWFHNRIRLATVVAMIFLGGIVQTQAARAYCQSGFRKYFQGFEAAGARVNPVERFIFSLLLTETGPAEQVAHPPRAQSKQL